jgi:predicted O-methyltransferase YrrM
MIDIGASVGDTAIYFTSLKAKKIWAYEIDSELAKLASMNVELNDLQEKIKIIDEAATAEKLNRLIADKDMKAVFMKIDCEGCEYELINGLDLFRTNDIVIEYCYEISR